MLNNINTHKPYISFPSNEASVKTLPAPPAPPQFNLGRDTGDLRTAKQIANNPLFAKLNHLPTHMLNGFYAQVGGNWNDKKLSPNTRADIAANAERVLKYIDSRNDLRPEANNGKIDGFKTAVVALPTSFLTPGHLAKPQSEAMALLMYAELGSQALQ